MAAGSVMTVDVELDGHRFTALTGGPAFTFDEAISLQVYGETQEEVARTGLLWRPKAAKKA